MCLTPNQEASDIVVISDHYIPDASERAEQSPTVLNGRMRSNFP